MALLLDRLLGLHRVPPSTFRVLTDSELGELAETFARAVEGWEDIIASDPTRREVLLVPWIDGLCDESFQCGTVGEHESSSSPK